MKHDPWHSIAELLVQQHRQLATLLNAVAATTGADRHIAFNDFRRLLAAHEAAEEEAVHPAARRAAAGAVEQRLAEEHQLGQLLSTLEQLDTGSAEFDQQLAHLRTAITSHNRREETQEFPALNSVTDAPTLIQLRHIVSQVPALAGGVPGTEPFVLQTEHHRQRFRGTADAGQI